MKAIFMKMLEEEYKGDPDAYIQEMARVSLEEVIEESYDVVTKHVCPNCHDKSYLHSMIQKEDEVECLDCGQQYIEVDNALRFK